MARREADEKLSSRIDKALEVRARFGAQEGPSAKDAFEAWDSYNVEMLLRMFTGPSVAQEYRHCGPAPIRRITANRWLAGARRADLFDALEGRSAPREDTERLIERFAAKLSRLRQLREQLELFAEPTQAPGMPPTALSGADAPRRAAFIVHGHDEGAREATARVLQQLDIEPIILHEQPNQGRTILEKFEAYADVPFAVVLLTPDDVGATYEEQSDELKRRARQNVIFELGFFVGKLGRDKVCPLYKVGVELPSDLDGLVYVPMDEGGAWRFKLADELHAAGIEIDFNRLRRS
jgi:predicted nucleotide-binding protein